MMSKLFAATLSLAALAGCGDSSRGSYSTGEGQPRDIVKADELYHQALGDIGSDPENAEKLLRAALDCDLYHGAAHNNLGVLLLKRNKLYDAAEEFEWARKLMPGHPEPRVNLAIALERGGKGQAALDAAKAGLETSPGNLPAIQTVAYIQVREGLTDASTKGYLDDIIMRSRDVAWQGWARRWRSSIERDELPSFTQP